MIRGAGSRAGWFHADACEIVGVDRPLSEVRAAFGEIDALIYNAGGVDKALADRGC
jgi:NAD(P)-dependent dehydrogenase (short-subunit alcohol dehydrogenase family)